MKNKILNLNLNQSSVWKLMILVLALSFTACDFEYDLPEANSKADETAPTAYFTYAQGQGTAEEWKDYTFSNLSNSATDYVWDFGDGNTSTDKDGKNTYPGEGTYTVTLTSSDKLGVTSTYSETIEVVEPEAPSAIELVILNPSFDEPGDDGKYTSPWVDGNMGKTIQISTSTSFVGGKSSKFPTAVTDPRIAYQSGIAVTPNTDYTITYYYSIETGDPSTNTVAVLAGTVTSPDDVAAATLTSFTGDVQGGKSDFQKVTLAFNTGVNTSISIHISNTGTKTSYVEEFTSAIVE
ncbi:PKD domain-containing protein [Marinifilum sp. RC60d5]|uniref:PKD domain-containing protein n=1 Tax=Marinifilum sp. RC60d5 TaxID=3458414 RepID=UPI00403730F9